MTRDLFKLAVFADAAVFEQPGRNRAESRIMFAGSTGGGINLLVLDTVQANMYYAVGIDSDLRFDHNLVLSVRKAF